MSGECTLVIGGEEYAVADFDIEVTWDRECGGRAVQSIRVVADGPAYHKESGEILGAEE